MKVVGVGAGPRMLTLEAIEAIGKSRLIYGSDRAIELVQEYLGPDCKVETIKDYKMLRDLPSDACVLSTGDPMLSGLGYLGGEIIPGISSMQVACARLNLSQLNVVPITVHGRRLETEVITSELKRGRCVFLLTDDSTDLESLSQSLEEEGLHKSVVALTDLGYPEERIIRGSTSSPPRAPGLSCVIIGDLTEARD
jgi:cobalt-precorrin-7 (C5)-methyltransferase